MRYIANLIFNQLFARIAQARKADLVIGEVQDPYLLRWYIIPRNQYFNMYLHCFMRSDDDRALHDHPWWSLSLLLKGYCFEHTIADGGIHTRRPIASGKWRLRSARFAHRIEVHPRNEAWTLFITGPNIREWGFHCPTKGWVHWEMFTDPASNGTRTGKGCDQ